MVAHGEGVFKYPQLGIHTAGLALTVLRLAFSDEIV